MRDCLDYSATRQGFVELLDDVGDLCRGRRLARVELQRAAANAALREVVGLRESVQNAGEREWLTADVHAQMCRLMFKLAIDVGEEAWLRFDGSPVDGKAKHDMGALARLQQAGELRFSLVTRTMLSYDLIALRAQGLDANGRTWAMCDRQQDASPTRSDSTAGEDGFGYRPYLSSIVVNRCDAQNARVLEAAVAHGSWMRVNVNRAHAESAAAKADSYVTFECGYDFVNYIDVTIEPDDSSTGNVSSAKVNDLVDHLAVFANAARTQSTAEIGTAARAALNSRYGQIRLNEAEVFNVGQGNCIMFESLVDGMSVDRLLFDVGYTRGARSNLPQTPPSGRSGYDFTSQPPSQHECARYIEAARSFDPELVVLSHWHANHVNGHVFLPLPVFRKLWIAPAFPPGRTPAFDALRLAAVVRLTGTLMLVDIADCDRNADRASLMTPTAYLLQSVELWQGKRELVEGEANVNAMNREGLMLSVESRPAHAGAAERVSALFMGDVPYSAAPAGLEPVIRKCSYLVVPHHGGPTLTDRIRTHEAAADESVAIICNRGTEQDLETVQQGAQAANGIAPGHVRALVRSGFIPITTGSAGLGISVKLSLPGAYSIE